MAEGVDGLLREKSRPPGTPVTPDERTAGVIRPTPSPRPHEATHRTLRAMGTLRGRRPRRCTGFGRRMVRRRTAGGCSGSRGIRLLSKNCTISWGFTSTLLRTQWCSRWMKSRKFRRWTERNPACRRKRAECRTRIAVCLDQSQRFSGARNILLYLSTHGSPMPAGKVVHVRRPDEPPRWSINQCPDASLAA